MLAKMRLYAKGFIVKIIFIFLAVAFLFWGIGDIFRNSGEQYVAKVGKEKINYYEFSRALNGRLEQLKGLYKTEVTLTDLKLIGEDRNILKQMIEQSLIRQRTKDLNVTIDDELIKNEIVSSKAFNDDSGKFSQNIFKTILKNNGLTPEKYFNLVRADKSILLLVSSFNKALPISDMLTEPLSAYHAEERKADILLVDKDYIKDIPEPSAKDLNQYYNDNSQKFSVPELRKISYVKFNSKIVTNNIIVTEEELKNEYTARKNEFVSEESKDLEQYLFDDLAAAKKAYDRLVNKQSVENKIILDKVTKTTLPEEIRNEVFALKDGEISKPLKSSLGYHVFFIKKTNPVKNSDFELVKEQIKAQIVENKKSDEFYKFINNLDNELAEGKTLEDLAKKYSLTLIKTEEIDQSGKNSQGVGAEIPDPAVFLPLVFKQEILIDSGVVGLSDNINYVVTRVDSVTPSKVKSLLDVKDFATSLLKAELKNKKLKEQADKLASQFKDSKDIVKFTKENKLALFADKLVKRYNSEPLNDLAKTSLPDDLVGEIFKLKLQAVSGAYRLSDGSYAIAKLKEVTVPHIDKNSEIFKDVKKELENSYLEAIYVQYLQYLRGEYGVTVNEKLFDQATKITQN